MLILFGIAQIGSKNRKLHQMEKANFEKLLVEESVVVQLKKKNHNHVFILCLQVTMDFSSIIKMF